MKKKFGTFLTIIFIGVFVIYFLQDPTRFNALREIPIYIVFIIAVFKLLIVVINGLFTKAILAAFGKNMDFKESSYLSLLSSIGNYFMPMQGGAGIRAIYLKTKYKLPYSYFISILSGNYIVTFLINSFIGLVSLIIIHQLTGVYSPLLYITFSIVFIGMIFLSIIQVPKKLVEKNFDFRYLNRIIKIIQEITKGWNIINGNKRLLFHLILLTLTNFIVATIITVIEFQILNYDFTAWNILLYTSLASLSLLISLTPGSIGIKEAIFIFSSSVLGITNNQILQLAVIDRGTLFFVLGLSYIAIRLIDGKNFLLKFRRNEHAKS